MQRSYGQARTAHCITEPEAATVLKAVHWIKSYSELRDLAQEDLSDLPRRIPLPLTKLRGLFWGGDFCRMWFVVPQPSIWNDAIHRMKGRKGHSLRMLRSTKFRSFKKCDPHRIGEKMGSEKGRREMKWNCVKVHCAAVQRKISHLA